MAWLGGEGEMETNQPKAPPGGLSSCPDMVKRRGRYGITQMSSSRGASSASHEGLMSRRREILAAGGIESRGSWR